MQNDPEGRTKVPNDQNGHGTNTMGIMAGKRIGGAQNATWISCKACNKNGLCSLLNVLECGQWTIRPTKPDGRSPNCSMAPRVSSNSWGGAIGEREYDGILDAYEAVGIIAIFSIGNDGPKCGSLLYPGSNESVEIKVTSFLQLYHDFV